jgi:aspartate kinase
VSERRILVQKYGGSSVATVEKLKAVAALVVAKKREGFDVVVVVSAMGDTTDELLEKAKAISKEPDRRELDMLLSAGERISMSLLAMAIREAGFEAVSLTGSQSGIITTASHASARIIEVRPFRVEDELELGRIVIVAGYQGVSYRRDVTTLGRGGSDTTAVALAAALDADACEIYSDVDGVYTADPRVVPDAKKLGALGYEEMQELATHGARVLNAQAVQFAKEKGIAIYARRTGSADPGTVIRRDVPKASSGVRGIAHETKVGTLDAAGVGAAAVACWLEAMEKLGVQPKQIAHTESGAFTAVFSLDDVHAEDSVRRTASDLFGAGAYRDDRGCISLIGDGIMRTAQVALSAIGALRKEGIEISAMSTSSFRVTLTLRAADVLKSVAVLHRAFALGTEFSAEAIL